MGAAPAAPLPLAGLALDRAAELREQPERLAAAWAQAQVVVVDFEGRAPVLGEPARLASVPAATLGPLPPAASLLGIDSAAQAWFALPATQLDPARRGALGNWQGLREAAAVLPAFEAGLFAYAKALLLWQTRAAFCGACGAPTRVERSGHCRRCTGAGCGLEHYPRTDAAVIVLVTHGPRILLGRQAGWPARRYSTLAGFVEPGESLEDALRREVLEEAGVAVGACSYRGSQPWPFPSSLMLGFRADAEHDRVQVGDELEHAFFIDAPDLLDGLQRRELRLSPPLSISFRLIADWLLENADPARVRALLPDA